MHRRHLLQAVAVGTVGTSLAGCNSRGGDPTPTASPTLTSTSTPTPAASKAPTASRLEEWHFDIHVLGAPNQSAPDVTFQAGSDRVVIEGVEPVGSSSCKRIGIDHVRYWEGTLRVGLAAVTRYGPFEVATPACTADDSSDSYRITVAFDDGLPDEVVVTGPPEDRSHRVQRPG